MTDRRALYAKTSIAQKDLAIEEDTFRLLLQKRYGLTSRKDMSDTQLIDLVEHFKSKGFKPKAITKTHRKMAAGREQGKMRALWISLWHLGVIDDASEEALSGFARRVTGGKHTGIEALQWINGDDAHKVIEALKDRATRDGGVSWEPVKGQTGRVVNDNPRHRVVEAQRRKLRQLGISPTYETKFLLSDAAADQLIAQQGEEIRRAKAGSE